jgi:O-antigen ligase
LSKTSILIARLLTLFFLVLPFISLNTDSYRQLWFRIWAGSAVLVACIPGLTCSHGISGLKRSWAFVFLAFFLAFLVLRLGVLSCLSGKSDFYFTGAKFGLWKYFILACFFLVGFVFWRSKRSVTAFLCVPVACSLFLALNCAPNLLSKGTLFYAYKIGGESVFLFPSLYKIHPWLNQYLLGVYAQANYIGDLMAFGFFPAAGLAFYYLRSYYDQKKQQFFGERVDRDRMARDFSTFFLFGVAALVTLTCILFALSRGTILALFAGLLFFLAGYLIKFLKKRHWVLAVAFLFLACIFVAWAGNIRKVCDELMSLQNENAQTGSLSVNAEGARRAVQIYFSHPVWGAGTDAYMALSQKYASFDAGLNRGLVNYVANNHYLQTLAQEGLGALFYGLFLAGYFLDLVKGLIRVKSRFQFMTALSLGAAVLMVLAHAVINYLMDGFTFPLLVVIFMGVSLGILQKDFRHARAA